MKIVVDSNIVFSAILNTQSKIGQLLIVGAKYFDFYSVGLLKEEIQNHKQKILKTTGFDEIRYYTAYQSIIDCITFLDDIVIGESAVDKAYKLVKDVDINDWPFVALNIELKAVLWSGDKKLTKGLQDLNYKRIISTEDLYMKYLEKEYKNRKE